MVAWGSGERRPAVGSPSPTPPLTTSPTGPGPFLYFVTLDAVWCQVALGRMRSGLERAGESLTSLSPRQEQMGHNAAHLYPERLLWVPNPIESAMTCRVRFAP